jgi:hypothetical protein
MAGCSVFPLPHFWGEGARPLREAQKVRGAGAGQRLGRNCLLVPWLRQEERSVRMPLTHPSDVGSTSDGFPSPPEEGERRRLEPPDCWHLLFGQHEFGEGPDEGVEAVGAFARERVARSAVEGDELVFEAKEFADVADAAFGVEG